MTPTESLTFVFAAGFLVVAAATRSTQAVLGAALLLAYVATAVSALPVAVRQWSPLVYLAGGYWVPALLVNDGPDAHFTGWLQRADAAMGPRRTRAPDWIVHAADVAYLLCYPLVPAGYAALRLSGSARDQERFWVTVLLAGFACYATLPWLRSLPPRRIAVDPNYGRPVGKLNVALLTRVSHGLNTFPSGHAAVAVAVTLALIPVPSAAIICGVIAAGVAAGAFLGRHHYLIDVVLGVAVGCLAWAIGRWIIG